MHSALWSFVAWFAAVFVVACCAASVDAAAAAAAATPSSSSSAESSFTVPSHAAPSGVVRRYRLDIGIVTEQHANERGHVRSLPFIVVNGRLAGPALHVRRGETLEVEIVNGLEEGTSIHWHGFEMHGYNQFDGVTKVTQCQIVRGKSFTVRFVVNEIAGTYWWHTHHEAHMGGQNYIKGPLIVHPADSSVDVAALTAAAAAPVTVLAGYAYADERIIMAGEYWHYTELLNIIRFEEPVAKAPNGMAVSHDFWGGKVNGDDRHVVYVAAGQTYKLRVINSGVMLAFRFSIDGFALRIVGSDGSPTEPYTADAVDLHLAERFDVEIDVPAGLAEGSTFWIRMRGLEDERAGYDYAINAILYVGSRPAGGDAAVPDPVSQRKPTLEQRTVNCYYRRASETCLPLTVLRARADTVLDYGGLHAPPAVMSGGTRFHTVDSDFITPPQFSHFMRLDDGPWVQFGIPYKPAVQPDFDASRDLHPHTNILHLALNTTVVMILRSTTKFIHPMHLHGHRFEVLETYAPAMHEACQLNRCRLPTYFDSAAKRRELAAMPRGSVFKDTVTMPGGGAVAIRFDTTNPGAWLAHCHINLHMEDGMMWLNLEGDSATLPATAFPPSFPDCMDPDRVDHHPDHPACACFENQDAILDNVLTSDYRCSRTALCYQAEANRTARVARRRVTGGIRMHEAYALPGWAITALITLGIAVVGAVIATKCAEAEQRVDQALPSDAKAAAASSERARRASSVASAARASEEAAATAGAGVVPDQVPGQHTGDDAAAGDESWLQWFSRGLGFGASPTRSAHTNNARRRRSSADGDASEAVALVSSADKQQQQQQQRAKDSQLDGDALTSSSSSSSSSAAATAAADAGGSPRAPSRFVDDALAVFRTEWALTAPGAINRIRIVEVVGLALISGFIFFEVGDRTTHRAMRESVSLLFFAVTLWTHTRMYVAVVFYAGFRRRMLKKGGRSLGVAVVGRVLVDLAAEFWWPLIYTAVAFPMAQMAGVPRVWLQHGILLGLNCICYIALGAILGASLPSIPLAMSSATLLSQMSLLCAGFYTSLPPGLAWIRHISPMWYTFSGMARGHYRFDDSFECIAGDTDLGLNQCYLEMTSTIDDLKFRGMNVATSYRANSDDVGDNIAMLVLLAFLLYSMVYVALRVGVWCRRSDRRQRDDDSAAATATAGAAGQE